jgi:thioredoxin-related protein
MPYYQKNNFSFDTEDADVVRTEIQDNYTVVSQKGSSINIIEFDDTNNKIYNLVGEIDSDTAIQILKKISNQ